MRAKIITMKDMKILKKKNFKSFMYFMVKKQNRFRAEKPGDSPKSTNFF